MRILLLVAFLVLLPMLTKPAAPVIQVAMLDLAGPTRGGDTNELAAFHQQWQGAAVQSFGKTSELEAWEKNWPAGNQPVVKVIYDRSAGEVRVVGRQKGREFQKVFPVEQDLTTALQKAAVFIRQERER